MDIEEKLDYVKVRIGDVPSSLFHGSISDADYIRIIENSGGNLERAVVACATSMFIIVASYSTATVIDGFTVKNDAVTGYRRALEFITKNPLHRVPENMIPWVAGRDDKPTKLSSLDLDCSDSCTKFSRGC